MKAMMKHTSVGLLAVLLAGCAVTSRLERAAKPRACGVCTPRTGCAEARREAELYDRATRQHDLLHCRGDKGRERRDGGQLPPRRGGRGGKVAHAARTQRQGAGRFRREAPQRVAGRLPQHRGRAASAQGRGRRTLAGALHTRRAVQPRAGSQLLAVRAVCPSVPSRRRGRAAGIRALRKTPLPAGRAPRFHRRGCARPVPIITRRRFRPAARARRCC